MRRDVRRGAGAPGPLPELRGARDYEEVICTSYRYEFNREYFVKIDQLARASGLSRPKVVEFCIDSAMNEYEWDASQLVEEMHRYSKRRGESNQ